MRISRFTAFVFSAILPLLLITGCSDNPLAQISSPLEKHSGMYDATANISYRGLDATATISQTTPDRCSVQFSSPASLQDMAFVFTEDSVDVSYRGLSFSFDPGSMPSAAISKLAVSAINSSFLDENIELTRTDSGILLDGVSDGGEFTLQLDGESGNFLKLSIPSQELEIEFENFRFLD